MSDADFDVVIIGGGVGGLVSAGKLALRGLQPVLLEATDRLGGRFSTIEKDGYRLPTGAIAIETGGPFFETFAELGIDPELRMPDPPVLIRIRGRALRPGAPVWEHMMKRVTKAAGRVAEGIAEGRSDGVEDDISLARWTRRYTRSKTLAGLFQSLSAAIFTVNSDELPARAFFRHLRETGAYKRFGYAPRGNAEIANKLGEAIVAHGGEVRRGWTATKIVIDDDQIATAVLATDPSGAERHITTRAVICNAGPWNTAQLVAGSTVSEAFATRVRDTVPSSMLALAFSTEHDALWGHQGIMNFTDTERLCSIANLSGMCPDLAPPGRILYEAYACPRPALGGGHDVEAERAILEMDLRRIVPGFDDAEIILFKNMEGRMTPAQQCAPGSDIDPRTPIANLVDVGDGVKPYGWIGTTACAHTANTAVDLIVQYLDTGGVSTAAPAGV